MDIFFFFFSTLDTSPSMPLIGLDTSPIMPSWQWINQWMVCRYWCQKVDYRPLADDYHLRRAVPTPIPYTLHPTPYTPTPYTIRHTSYTLHLTPYTLHPTPYTLHPTPYTLHPRTFLAAASERRGINSKRFEDFHLKAKTRICR